MPFFSLPPCMLIAGYETHRLEDFIYININCLYVLYYHLSKKKYIYIFWSYIKCSWIQIISRPWIPKIMIGSN